MFKSIVKLLLSPRRASIPSSRLSGPIIILGNGPSLNDVMSHCRSALDAHPLMAVNFAANAPQFTELKPEFYVLADPHFFRNTTDANVSRLISNLNAVTWEMTLFIPFGEKSPVSNPAISVRRFPFKAMEGPAWFRNAMFSGKFGMPRPRNVLIPSLMISIWLGFNEIYICGADHSWLRTLSVNSRNEVVSVQPHFYKEDERELERQRVDYLRIPLHKVLESQMIAFRSYHIIQDFAAKRGVTVYNATEGSFIDAFPRKTLATDD